MNRARVLCVSAMFGSFVACGLQGQPAAPRLGTVAFPTSGGPAAQEAFLRGVLYLHSFEYEKARTAFVRAEQAEPGFAMAYWGEAMTYTHAVWNEQDLAAARDALSRLAPTPEARRAKAPTPREQAYLGAVEQLYGEGSKPRRDTLYQRAMEQLVRNDPADLEAKAFYALALLGLNQGVRDTITYLRAAPYADTVFKANPDHPGAAHYLIHAFDDPFHAWLGLEAARSYSRIAPDAAHAQHMTTHIFLALGMWDEVVSQNRIAIDLTAPLPGHYSSWLVYGLIQQGKYGQAESMISELRRHIEGEGTPSQNTALVAMRSHFVLHNMDYRGSVLEYQVPYDRMSSEGVAVDVFTDGVVAFRRRNTDGVTNAANQLSKLAGNLATDRGAQDPLTLSARVMTRELGGMALFLGGSREQGVRVLREAAAMEDAIPMDFGPPIITDPSHEVLGVMLLELDPEAAKSEFEKALQRAPGRSSALIGLVRASVAVGDKATARRALDQVLANWKLADPRVRNELTPLRRLVDRLP